MFKILPIKMPQTLAERRAGRTLKRTVAVELGLPANTPRVKILKELEERSYSFENIKKLVTKVFGDTKTNIALEDHGVVFWDMRAAITEGIKTGKFKPQL